jgi:hypothetical protein
LELSDEFGVLSSSGDVGEKLGLLGEFGESTRCDVWRDGFGEIGGSFNEELSLKRVTD